MLHLSCSPSTTPLHSILHGMTFFLGLASLVWWRGVAPKLSTCMWTLFVLQGTAF